MNDAWQDKPHILVVDDDDRLRTLLKRFLSEQGFIVTVADGTGAAKTLKRRSSDRCRPSQYSAAAPIAC